MSTKEEVAQGDPEGTDGKGSNASVDDQSANGNAGNPDIFNGTDGQGSVDGQDDSEPGKTAQEPATSSVAQIDGGRSLPPPHVRKSSDAALRVVATQVSSPQATSTSTTQQSAANANLAQITDILLAKLITTLSDSALGNPALLLQTLLGFSPEDYNDLLAALSESGSSYVDIIAAYLHNIRVMSEDSGSASATLSGTLTRSLIEQYNALLAQALRTPRNHASHNLGAGIGDLIGQGSRGEVLLNRPNGTVGPIGTRSGAGSIGRRSFDNSANRVPTGLGFGRRSLDSARSRPNVVLEPHSQGTANHRMVGWDPTIQLSQTLDGLSLHQEQPATADLGYRLVGGDGNPNVVATQPLVNPALLQHQVLAGHSPQQLAGLLQNLSVQANPYVQPGPAVQLSCDGLSNLGAINPGLGLGAPTMPAIPTLQPGISSLPNGVTPAHVLAGHGIIPQWPNLGAVNGQTVLSQLQLMHQAGEVQAGAVPVPQPWDHMSSIHENSTVQMIPEQPPAVAAPRPGMPINDELDATK